MEQEAKDIAAAAAAQLIKDSLSAFVDGLSGPLAVQRVKYFERFQEYSRHMYNKCINVRTLYSKNAPVLLDDIYGGSRFFVGEKHLDIQGFSENELTRNFVNGQRIIVKGNGGSGKTIFLKHLWIQRFKERSGRLPVLIELRRLNDHNTVNLQSFCKNELRAGELFRAGAFEELCKLGKFEFIFDGFDEVDRTLRRIVEQQILEFANSYKKCSFLVSGREDDRFIGWADFETYSVASLNLSEVKSLIEKIPFDRKVKRKFLENLNEEFYEIHESFLSSPLLAVMMLMTFSDNAIIPKNLTSF